MKKFIIPVIIAVLVFTIIIIISTVNFGGLAVAIIERTAKIEIDYENIQGNILTGFRIEDYIVKISETDSIHGPRAEIYYQLRPFIFSLPNLFNIYLIEPTIFIKSKEPTAARKEFLIPNFNLGLRLNLKNARFVYQGERDYVLDNISGLVLVDFIGPIVFLNTMNLSFQSRNYPIKITSADLNLRLERNVLQARAFNIRGDGILLQGDGRYSWQEKRASVKFKNAEIDMARIDLHKGRIKFFGDIEYGQGNLLPRIQGVADDFFPFEKFRFETNGSSDTILVNLFDGELLEGTLFAQVRIINLKRIDFEANFKDLNLNTFLKSKTPVTVNGYIVYREKKFSGLLSSPFETGLGIDSLYVFGSATKSEIFMDSLFFPEKEHKLFGQGKVYPNCDFAMKFNTLDLAKFSKYLPIAGILSGQCSCRGRLDDPKNIIFTADLQANAVSIQGIPAKKIRIESSNFQIQNPKSDLKVLVEQISISKLQLEKFTLSVANQEFLIETGHNRDSLMIAGTLERNWQGEISTLSMNYNGVATKNITPIKFDFLNKKVDTIELSFLDGELRASIEPPNISLSRGNLEKLGLLLGVREKMQGNLDIKLENNQLSVNGTGINFAGLRDGAVTILGTLKNQGIEIETCQITDMSNQNVLVKGMLSAKESDLKAEFSDVGIWIFPFLRKFMKQPEGLMRGAVTFQGNIDNFKFGGVGEVRNASFGINAISAKFDSITSKVRFDGNRIIFESINGNVASMLSDLQSGRSKANGSGVIRVDPRFRIRNLNFDFSFQNAPIQYLPFVYGTGSGNFTVGVKEGIAYYNGNIAVKEGIVPMEFGQETKPIKEGDTLWTMNIKIRGERNIWLRNREADIEFSGELFVIQEHTPLYIAGNLETMRGNFYWLNHVLSITSGTVTFVPEEIIDPTLDIWAEMDARENVKIILHCFGTLAEPIFEFFSDPPIYSEQDILTYLSLNITWNELEQMKRGEFIGNILPISMLTWLESDVSRRLRQATGLDYFRLEMPLTEAGEKTKLTFGKYVSRDLFITYTYGVTTFSNEFNVEYFINDKNEILIKKDDTGEYSLQYQYRIRF